MSQDHDPSEESADPGLTVGEVTARTGVPMPTLRSWEARHGFPVPRRRSSGHRRYDERDCQAILDVLRARDSGLSLAAAIAAVRDADQRGEPSIFASLRRAAPDLPAVVLATPHLLAVCRAMEHECLATAERPVAFGAFQTAAHYRRAQARWDEIARTAEHAVVFAGFDRPVLDRAPAEVPLGPAAPARREWAVVFDSPTFAAALAGWERPLEADGVGRRRSFEVVWTAERRLVRTVARVCAAMVAPTSPDLSAALVARLADTPAAAGPDARSAGALTARMVAYLADLPPTRPADLPSTRPADLPPTRPADLPSTRPADLPPTRPADVAAGPSPEGAR
jgi:DNA-binding transcriptional MerR regulator